MARLAEAATVRHGALRPVAGSLGGLPGCSHRLAGGDGGSAGGGELGQVMLSNGTSHMYCNALVHS